MLKMVCKIRIRDLSPASSFQDFHSLPLAASF
jgi:hypothetical protein